MNTDALAVRIAALDNQEPLSEETIAYMKLVREETHTLAVKLAAARPEYVDPGRFIAAIDKLQETKDLFCNSAIQGSMLGKRKQANLEAAQAHKK